MTHLFTFRSAAIALSLVFIAPGCARVPVIAPVLEGVEYVVTAPFRVFEFFFGNERPGERQLKKETEGYIRQIQALQADNQRIQQQSYATAADRDQALVQLQRNQERQQLILKRIQRLEPCLEIDVQSSSTSVRRKTTC